MFRFQHPSYLTALVLIPVLIGLFALMLLWRRKLLQHMGTPEIVARQLLGYIPARAALKFILTALALTFIIIGAANLQKGGATETISRKGVDVMIGLDVSKSMLAQDISPDRLTRAKQLIERLTEKLGGDRVGLVIFAGRSYLQVPLTVDFSALKLVLQTITPDMVPTQGTVIGDAVNLCNHSFSGREKKFKSIILISDGEDHDASAIGAVKIAAEDGAIVHTVGIGSPQGATLFDPSTNAPKLDPDGNPVVTKLNETELKNIAAAGNGTYTLLGNTDAAAGKLADEIDGIEQRNLGAVVFADYSSYFQYFLLIGFVLLLIEWLIPGAGKRKKITTAKALPAVLLLACTPIFAQAQSAKKLIAEGNKSYERGDYKTAAGAYAKAAQKDTALAPKAAYNLGNALYRQNQIEQARQAYTAASKKAGNKTEAARANYNAGNTYMSEKKWSEAAESFKQALRQNPQDADAKYNLSYALQMMKKDNNGGKGKNDKKDQDKKDEDKKKEENKDQQKKEEQNQNGQPKEDENKQGEQPQPSKMSEKQAEQLLNALQQEEKKLQEKNKKRHGTPVKMEKDW